MKKLIYKLSVIAGLVLMLTSCEKDFLDKPIYGVLAAEDYFKTEEELQEGVFSCYDVLQWAYNQDWNSMYVVKSFPSDESHAGGRQMQISHHTNNWTTILIPQRISQ